MQWYGALIAARNYYHITYNHLVQVARAVTGSWCAACSDVPTKEFILSLNDSKPTNERFVIHDLDDTHLFVQPTVVEWLEKRLKEFHEENTYQPPRREEGH